MTEQLQRCQQQDIPAINRILWTLREANRYVSRAELMNAYPEYSGGKISNVLHDLKITGRVSHMIDRAKWSYIWTSDEIIYPYSGKGPANNIAAAVSQNRNATTPSWPAPEGSVIGAPRLGLLCGGAR